MTIGLTLAALAGGTLLLGWIGYPLLLRIFGGSEPPDNPSPTTPLVEVSVVIATREAPNVVRARVSDILLTTWPSDALFVVVGIDPSAPYAVAEYQEALAASGRVKIVMGDPPGGKADTLNAAMRNVTSPVVVFADSAQSFAPDAVPTLVEAVLQEDVAGVTGRISSAADEGLLAIFWKYEMAVRRLESRVGCVVNMTGAIHAMRRNYWEPLPSGLISDDLLIPLRLGRQGLHVVMADHAAAHDPRTFTRDAQLIRKVRTLTGILQIAVWEPWVLLPWKNRMWAAFICHKLIRVATPLLGLLMVGGLLTLLPLHMFAVLVTAGCVGLLGLVLASRRTNNPVVAEAVWALRLLTAPLIACRNALLANWAVWAPAPK